MWCLTKIASQVRLSAPVRSRDEIVTHRHILGRLRRTTSRKCLECKNGGLEFVLVEHIQGALHFLL